MDHLKKANLASPEAQNAIYNDGELAFFTSLHNLPSHSPIQLEIYIIGLVREGKGIANINGNSYEVQKNDLFVCQPYNIVEKGLVSLDFKGYFILVSSGFMQRTMPMARQSLDIKFMFEQNPVCSLLPEEAKVFCQYYELLYTKIQQASPMQKKVIDTLMLAFFYDMKAALNRVIRQSKPRPFRATHGNLVCRPAARHAQIPLDSVPEGRKRIRIGHHRPLCTERHRLPDATYL